MASSSDKSVKLQLLADVDKATAKASQQSVASIRKEYEALDKTAQGFSKRVDRYFSTGEKAADDARRSVSAMQRELAQANSTWGDPRSVQVVRQRVDAFENELSEAKALVAVQKQRVEVEEQINRTQSSRPAAGGGVDRAQSAGDVSTGLSAVGAVLPGGAGNAFRTAGDIAGVAENLPRLTAGLAGLGVSVGSVLAVAAPLAIAVGAIAIVMDRAEKANRAYLATEEEIARLRITGTSEDAQVQLLAAQEELAIAQARVRDIYLQKFSRPVNLENFIATLGGSGGLDKALADAQAQAGAASSKIDALNQELEKGTFAANDAAAAEKRLAEGRIAEIQAAADLRLQIEGLKDSASSGQIEEMIAATQREIAVRQQQIREMESQVGTTEEGIAQIAALSLEIENLTEKERLLQTEVVGVVAAREAEIAALEAQNDLLKTAQDKAAEVAATQKQFNEAVGQLEEQTAERREQVIEQSAGRILDIETRLADSIASTIRDASRANDAAARKLEDDIAKVGQEAAEQEISLRDETADRINDLEERAAAERQRILRDYNRSANQAIQDRDAVALDQARQTRNDALKDNEKQLEQGVKEEREALKKRLEEQKRSNEQRLRDLRQSYEQEQRERQIALNQKLADLQQNAANEIAITRQKQAEALAALNQAYAEQRTALIAKYAEQFKLLTGHYVSLNALTATALNEMYDKWEAFYNDLAGSVMDAQSGTRTTGSYSDPRHEQGVRGMGGYARGVRNAKPGWNVVGEEGPEPMWVPGGSNIYSNQEGREMFGGTSVTMAEGAIVIHIQSTDARGIVREIERKLPDMMADAVEKSNGRRN
jgi:hypothetical protein